MTSGALVQVGRPPATRGFDGAAVPKGRFDPEPPWTPEERRIHVQGRSEPHRLQADQIYSLFFSYHKIKPLSIYRSMQEIKQPAGCSSPAFLISKNN